MESGNACHSLCGPILMGDLCIPPTSPPLPRGQSTFILDPGTLPSGSVAVPGGVGGGQEEQTDQGSQWVIIGTSGWTEGLGYPNGGRLRTRRSTWFPRVGYPRTGAEHAARQKDASLPLDTGWGEAPHQVTRVSCAESPVDQCQCLLGTIYSVPVHGELCLELGHSPPLSVVRSVGEGGRVVGRRESGDTYEYRE